MHAVRASLRLLSILFCRCWSFAFFHCLPVLRNPFHDFSLQFRDNAVSLHHPLPSALPSSPSSPLAARLDCHLTSLTPFFRFHIAWYRFHLSLSLHTIIIASPRTHTYSIFPSHRYCTFSVSTRWSNISLLATTRPPLLFGASSRVAHAHSLFCCAFYDKNRL